VSKKLIIITAAAGLISFAGAFAFAWLTKPTPIIQSTSQEDQSLLNKQQADLELPQPKFSPAAITEVSDETIKQTLPEKQLKNLVYEVQQQMQEYDKKLQSLQQREKRLQIAHETLKKDIENLNNLRTELASIVANMKEQRDKLLKSRIEIANAEKANLVKIAAAYDKMDAASAGKILTNMCKSQIQNVQSANLDLGELSRAENNMSDAVKILHYMSERAKAKLLAELVTSEPELSAVLCRRLKQIVEQR
jgi:chromosome segregation ATPase